jgi:hypothetical protein
MSNQSSELQNYRFEELGVEYVLETMAAAIAQTLTFLFSDENDSLQKSGTYVSDADGTTNQYYVFWEKIDEEVKPGERPRYIITGMQWRFVEKKLDIMSALAQYDVGYFNIPMFIIQEAWAWLELRTTNPDELIETEKESENG